MTPRKKITSKKKAARATPTNNRRKKKAARATPTNNRRKKKDGRGRPKINKTEYIDKLRPFIQNGMSVAAACREAKIPHSTVSDYLLSDKHFSEEIELAKQTMEKATKNLIALAVQAGSLETAKWWLERKCKDEFSTRTENVNENHDGEITLVKIPENGREGGVEPRK